MFHSTNQIIICFFNAKQQIIIVSLITLINQSPMGSTIAHLLPGFCVKYSELHLQIPEQLHSKGNMMPSSDQTGNHIRAFPTPVFEA
jgi:hypothetical protein